MRTVKYLYVPVIIAKMVVTYGQKKTVNPAGCEDCTNFESFFAIVSGSL